jgi:membrane-associated phospholipid phosphatase
MTKFSIRAFTALVLSCVSVQSFAVDSTTRNANIVTGGLPVLAAGLSYLSNDTDGVVQLIKSEAATVLLTEGLKNASHQTRPDGSDNKSFPSRHAAVAFSAAQYMQMKGGWEYGLPSYAAAAYVANARVESNRHRWRDVAAGAATGAATTYYFTDDKRDSRFGVMWTGSSATFQYQQALR